MTDDEYEKTPDGFGTKEERGASFLWFGVVTLLVGAIFVAAVVMFGPPPTHDHRAYGPVKLPIGTDDRSICLDERVSMVAILATVRKVDRENLHDDEIVRLVRHLAKTREPMYPYDLKPHYAEAYK